MTHDNIIMTFLVNNTFILYLTIKPNTLNPLTYDFVQNSEHCFYDFMRL